MRPLVRKPLRKGMLVYHGTSSSEEFEDLRGPAWVSDAETVAREFVSWAGGNGRPRILTFRMLRAPRLAIVTSDRELRELAAWVEEKTGIEPEPGPVEFAQQVCDSRLGLDGWHIPNNYPSGSDTMICEPGDFLEFVSTSFVDEAP